MRKECYRWADGIKTWDTLTLPVDDGVTASEEHQS